MTNAQRFANRNVLKALQEARDSLEAVLWNWAPEGLSQPFIEACQKAYDLLQEAIMTDVALPELYEAQNILVDDIVFKAFSDGEDKELQEWLNLWRNHYLNCIFSLLAYALRA